MIYIENLDFGYQKKRAVFSGLNLSLTGGHIYGLLGKNGAGKTTLLKLIGGLLFPLRGRIEVCDAIPRLRKPSFLSDIFFILFAGYEDERLFPFDLSVLSEV